MRGHLLHRRCSVPVDAEQGAGANMRLGDGAAVGSRAALWLLHTKGSARLPGRPCRDQPGDVPSKHPHKVTCLQPMVDSRLIGVQTGCRRADMQPVILCGNLRNPTEIISLHIGTPFFRVRVAQQSYKAPLWYLF